MLSLVEMYPGCLDAGGRGGAAGHRQLQLPLPPPVQDHPRLGPQGDRWLQPGVPFIGMNEGVGSGQFVG